MSRVLLVNMPFSNLRWPNLGPSLLKAGLLRRGVACDMAYLNFDFAERIGLEPYEWVADQFAFVLGGERMFARHYFGDDRLPGDDAYWHDVLAPSDAGLDNADRRTLAEIERHVEPFLDACMARIDWARYAVVGFAASFQQTMPSLCLARRIKQARPETVVVFGGSACEGEMGVELIRQFPEIDYVFLGEADLSFPPVVEAVLSGRTGPLPPGVVGRGAASGRTAAACCELVPLSGADRYMVERMDDLPYPDFDDYFGRLRSSPLQERIDALLFFETSRGCWWGERRHCAFCGLNGSALRFRSKSPDRALDELRWLVERYDVHRACSADNIFDPRYYDTLLPMLEDSGIDLSFVYEMKTNLTREQVRKLLDAGLGAAQLGIETFSTPVLKRVGKGASATQNLQALKWFSEAGIEVKWNILYGFPGEDPAEYAALAELMPSLYHLAPPLAAGRVRLDRFSPYFEDPAAHGMARARPSRAFRYVYPFPDDVLARLAHYYEYEYADGRNPTDYAAPMLEAVRAWQDLKGSATLRYFDRSDGVLIVTDTRPGAEMLQRRLGGLERELYLFCDTGRSMRKIAEFAQSRAGGERCDEAAIRARLDGWLAARLAVRLDERYVSLALRAPD
jgi:ribosomal peptide maturation radical SAM protein 1